MALIDILSKVIIITGTAWDY